MEEKRKLYKDMTDVERKEFRKKHQAHQDSIYLESQLSRQFERLKYLPVKAD